MLVQTGGYISVVPDNTPSASITASGGGGVTRPHLVLVNYDATIESRSEIVDLLDDNSLIILNEGRPRSGTLNLLYLSDALASAALELHQRRGTLALVELSRPIVNMTYVSMGATLQLNPTARNWTLSVRFQEVRL